MMGGSYRQCTECGKRALSIATRCPGCGRELPAPAVPEHGGVRDLSGLLSPQGAAVLVAIVAVLASARLGRTSQPGLPEESSFVSAAAVTPPGTDFSEVAASGTTTAPAATAGLGATAVGEPGGLRVARTWTHVRKARSKQADLEAVLLPGDTVLADSLGKGWYRVALEGEVLGYAHRSTLEVLGAQ